MSESNPDPDQKTANEFETASQQPPPSLISEFWQFIRENKAWWMIPILVCLGLMGIVIGLALTGAAPFIYTLF